MTEAKSINTLQESLTKALIALDQVYGYAHMPDSVLKVVQDARTDAEVTLQLTEVNMIEKAPYTMFGETRLVPVVVYTDDKKMEGVFEWDEEYWIERPEEWYGLMSHHLRHKRVRVIERSQWLIGEICKNPA